MNLSQLAAALCLAATPSNPSESAVYVASGKEARLTVVAAGDDGALKIASTSRPPMAAAR